MKGKTYAKVPSVGKKRRGKGEPLFAEESKSEDATRGIVVSDFNQEKYTAEVNKGGTKADKRDEDVEHKDRKDILVDDVSILHGVVLPEMQEKEDFDHPNKGDNQGMHKEKMRIEPLQICQEQSKQCLLVKIAKFKKSEEGTDLNKELECQDQSKKDNTSNHLSNLLEDFTSCFPPNLAKKESCNDTVKESPHQMRVHMNHDMSEQMNRSESENKSEQDRQQSIQVKMAISSKDINLQKSMTEHQILCDQNSTKHIEMIGKSPSISGNVVLSVSEYSEISPVHQSKTSNPDQHYMDNGLKETTKNTSSTNYTSDAETICFDSTNGDTSSIQKENMYAMAKDQTTSAYSKIMMDVMGQHSDNTTGNILCNVDAVLETIIQAKGHDNACASVEKTMQDMSSETVDATCHKLIQNSNTDRSVDTDCTCLDKPKIDTEMNFDKDGANFKMNLTDIISSNNKTNTDVNRQLSSMYNEDAVCQKKDLFPLCHQFPTESVELHSLQDPAKKPQIKDTDSIQNGCILLDEVSDEMISYSPIEAAEASVSQDPINSYAEGIQVNVAVPRSCRDDSLHNTDFTDSQLCEMDWSSQIMEEENTQSVEKPEPRINLSFPQQRIPDGTNIIKGLVKELTNLNKMLLRTKREIQAVRRQFGPLPSQQDKYPVFSRFHK
ncbi:hypothetical protein ACJMK2_038395 [Sinanodonta woodiana]|uniref:Uncharacterized protein n=1 Tax=Sinanodonta woodiana TaxID=1069815 RepID=A0ABD3W8V3_SINWO